eukprot:Partr_v1_DN27900_c0_g1_i2_m22913 putative n-acetyl-gamma-glutamyl-phosphate reductase
MSQRLLVLKSLLPRVRRHSTVSTSTRASDWLPSLVSAFDSRVDQDRFVRLSSGRDRPIAVVKVGGAVLTDELPLLVHSLKVMHCAGMAPVVLHGAGPQLNDILLAQGVEPLYQDGIRVTDERTLGIAKKCFRDENRKLVDALLGAGVPSQSITAGVFEADFLDRERYKLVGKITGVDTALIDVVINNGGVPVCTSLAETFGGQLLNVNADTAASELAVRLQPLKTIFLSGSGAMQHPVSKSPIHRISLSLDYEELLAELKKMPKKGTMLKLVEIKNLLDALPRTSSVSIVTASDLTRELFGSRGYGTFVYRGHDIRKLELSPNDLQTRLLKFMPRSEIEAYLARLQLHNVGSKSFVAFSDESGEAVAVLGMEEAAAARIDHIFASDEARSSPLLDDLWSALTRHYPNLSVACKAEDPMCQWYADKSEASLKMDGMQMFMTGVGLEGVVRGPPSPAVGSPFKSQKRAYSSSSKRVGLIGARGFTGQELISLIDKHRDFELAAISSRELKGTDLTLPHSGNRVRYENLSADDVKRMSQGDIDCWVLALPNGICKPFVEAITSSGKSYPSVVDLSADYRFTKEWIYGLPELYKTREIVRKKRSGNVLISNPGCYATGMQIGLFPLVNAGLLDKNIPPVIFGVSGVSGAGTNKTVRNDPDRLRDNLIPYSLSGHIHEREVGYHLDNPVNFIPHVAPFFRGITLTINAHLAKSATTSELRAMYNNRYASEPLITVLDEKEGECKDGIPLVKNIANNHGVQIGG